MSQSYFVRNLPFAQLGGHTSHGTHVFTESPERAAATAEHLGRTPVAVTECPGLFTCRCTENAAVVNAVAFPGVRV